MFESCHSSYIKLDLLKPHDCHPPSQPSQDVTVILGVPSTIRSSWESGQIRASCKAGGDVGPATWPPQLPLRGSLIQSMLDTDLTVEVVAHHIRQEIRVHGKPTVHVAYAGGRCEFVVLDFTLTESQFRKMILILHLEKAVSSVYIARMKDRHV